MRAHVVGVSNGPRCVLGESPRWDGRAWWWVDAADGDVWTRRPGAVARRAWRAGRRASLVHPERAGRVVVADSTVLVVLTPTGSGTWLASPWSDLRLPHGWLVNDGVADEQGRLWIGSIAPGGARHGGALLRVEPNGSVTEAATGFTLTNGMAWSVDGITLYHADSSERMVWAHTLDPTSAAVLASEVFVAFDDDDGLPDGLASDQAGGVWVAMYGVGQVRRYDSSGRLDLTVEVPTAQTTSVELGGADGRDLLVTTAREGFDAQRSAREPYAGRLFRARSPHPGLRKPPLDVN